MSHSRDDPRVRLAARLVAGLATTPDSGLERFAARRAADSRVGRGDLEIARDVIDAVGFALAGSDRANWQRIRQACEAIKRIAPPEIAPPAPEPHPARAAEAPRARAPSATAQPPPASRALPSTGGRGAGDDLDATQGIDALLASQEALPFSEGAAAMPPATPSEPHPDAGATSFAVPVVVDDALPFGARVSKTNAAPVGRAEQPPLGKAEPARLGVTPPEPAPPMSLPADDVDGTREINALLLEEDALPFESPAPVALTLQQYVSYVVELERAHDAQSVQSRYGIAGEAEAARLVAHWQARLAARAELREDFPPPRGGVS